MTFKEIGILLFAMVLAFFGALAFGFTMSVFHLYVEGDPTPFVTALKLSTGYAMAVKY